MKKIFVLFLSMVLGMTSAFTQTAVWKPAAGPPTLAWIGSIAVSSKGTIFAAGVGKLIRSTDNGRQWEELAVANATQIATKSDSYVVVACWGRGIYVSKDNGETWTESNNGLTDLQTIRVAIDSSGNILTGTSSGIVFRSTDDGKTWMQLGSPMPSSVYSIQVARSGNIYANAGKGLYVLEAGEWTQVMTVPEYHSLSSFVVDSNENLFAAIQANNATDNYVQVSTNHGASWTRSLSLGSSPQIAIHHDTVYAGSTQLFRSSDKGATWTTLSSFQIGNIAWLGYPADHMLLVVDALSDILLSSDEGEHWTNILKTEASLPYDASVRYICSNTKGDLFALGTARRFWRSTDGGAHWTINGLSPNLFYMSADDVLWGVIGGALYRSTDNGDTWKTVIDGITYDPTATIPGSGPKNCIFFQSYISGRGRIPYLLMRSLDNGDTWANVGFEGVVVSSVNYIGESVFLAVTPGATYRSADFGKTWSTVPSGLKGTVNSIYTTQAGTVLAAGDSGIYISADKGVSWQKTDGGSIPLPVYTLAANSKGIICAGTQSGVYRSKNDGSGWEAAGLESMKTTAIVFDKTDDVIASTSGGMFLAVDDSLHWININNGLPQQNITTLLVNADGYAYLSNSSVYKTKVPVAEVVSWLTVKPVSVTPATADHPATYLLAQNYPNPFNPTTTLAFSLPSRVHVSLKIFDVMGREVATIVEEEMPAGRYARQWNASGYSSGVYFYRLQTGAFTETKRLVILK